MELTTTEITEIKELLTYPKGITIISHRNPDGDAIGSSLGLKLFLEKFGHTVKVVLPSDYPGTFHFLKGIDECIIYDTEKAFAVAAIEKADVLFCLDFNSLDRIDKVGPYIQDSKAKKLLIDHHLDPEPFADYVYSDTKASSTCELIYMFIVKLAEQERLDAEIGEALFTGLITHT